MRPDIKKSTQLGGIANLALMAPVKPGFIPGADTFRYDKRLKVLFKTLNAIRLGARESARFASPFPDAIGRWGLLHSFRYALIPPEIGSDGETPSPEGGLRAGVYRLYLNVTFDGGWEPYLRVIYRDLGPMLDTIFCNCDGYLVSTKHSYDAYIRWVRRQEVPAGLFYTDSPLSVLDQHYLEEVERLQRHEPDPARARELIAGLALKPTPSVDEALRRFGAADAATRQEVVRNNLRALKGLYDLRALYADNEDGDEACLRHFTQGAMREFRAFLATANTLRFDAYREPIDWLLKPLQGSAPVPAFGAGPAEAQIQPGILSRCDGVTHGCLLLAAVTDPQKARAWIGAFRLAIERQHAGHGDAVFRNIAFTPQGLRALGQAAETLDLFPQEFVDGMEVRAGLLGDVRGNHPEHWQRPRFKGTGPEIDLASVHVVVQYRIVRTSELDRPLHSDLQALAAAVTYSDCGLLLLSTEPMRSYPNADGLTTEHFGFQDGFSQPELRTAPAAVGRAFDNTVAPGELFLGQPNDRQDVPAATYADLRVAPATDTLLKDGSFLVIRKLRQHVPRWHAVLRQAASAVDPMFRVRSAPAQQAAMDGVAAMMVGRQRDGTLVLDPALKATNDFNYEGDPQGSRCPFQSHIRRSNPRPSPDGTHRVPRLMRRGMSYGLRFEDDPQGERGLFFMAYCGSIAEQFEVIQRWVSGGNSSGVLAAHSDPLLGVPQKGVPRSFRWLGSNGQVMQVDLGDEPLTELAWGLYLFTPSLAGLVALAADPVLKARSSPPKKLPEPEQEAYDPASPAFEERKRLVQGTPAERDSLWGHVNEHGGTLQTAYGLLVSDKDKVMQMLRDKGTRHSVCGYGRRFAATVGPGFLGMDPARGHQKLAEDTGINDAIAWIDEEAAFDAARTVTLEVLARLAPAGQETAVDLVRMSETAIAALYKRWFGLPDGKHMLQGFSSEAIENLFDDAARCPRDFFYVARYNFGPHPAPKEIEKGQFRGQAIHRAIRGYLDQTKPEELVELSAAIYQGLVKRAVRPPKPDEVADIIGGVMLGFGPSVHLHCVNVMREWIDIDRPDARSLWDVQVRLQAAGAAPGDYVAVKMAMRADLVAQMCKDPVPSLVWRERPGAKPGLNGVEPEKFVAGLHGLMDDPDAEALMFGGSRDAKSPLHTVHACPGHGMAIGVLLGIISTLLLAGTLRKSPSPTILMVER